MTDYNDGKWHGWNGGECPVHPEAVVEVRGESDNVWKTAATSEKVYWPNVIVFRVVTPYVEPAKPREWWATGRHLHNTREEADAFIAKVRGDNPDISFADFEPVLVREVLA